MKVAILAVAMSLCIACTKPDAIPNPGPRPSQMQADLFAKIVSSKDRWVSEVKDARVEGVDRGCWVVAYEARSFVEAHELARGSYKTKRLRLLPDGTLEAMK
jgi:hypothetical protein